jgi:hypothetical protein
VEKEIPNKNISKIPQGTFWRERAKSQPTRIPKRSTKNQGTLCIPWMNLDNPNQALEMAPPNNKIESKVRDSKIRNKRRIMRAISNPGLLVG